MDTHGIDHRLVFLWILLPRVDVLKLLERLCLLELGCFDVGLSRDERLALRLPVSGHSAALEEAGDLVPV